MILGLGLDLCSVSRMEALMENEAFLKRYFTDHERLYLHDKGLGKAESLAGLFAAKEALLKALGLGLAGGALSEVEVFHDEKGAPKIKVSGQALKNMRAMGAQSAHLSISHDSGMAAAVCVLEGGSSC